MASLQKKLKDLKIRHGMGDIDKETYDLTLEHINTQIETINKELSNAVPQISNLEKLLSDSVEKLGKLSLIWASSDLENKRRLQKTLFPEGVFYNVKKHEYLTTKTNEFIELTRSLTQSYAEKENANLQEFLENSRSVVPTGIEPVSKV